jgi:hypothetical protein
MLALAKPPFNTRFKREQAEIRDRQGRPLKKYFGWIDSREKIIALPTPALASPNS